MGTALGLFVGTSDGNVEGGNVGLPGRNVGRVVGDIDGAILGHTLGFGVGCP